jgi:hypothetical protein
LVKIWKKLEKKQRWVKNDEKKAMCPKFTNTPG